MRTRVQNTSDMYNQISDSETEPDDEYESDDDGFAVRPKVFGFTHVKPPTPASDVFRFQNASFRLEPEWQYDDTDVLHAWQKLDLTTARCLPFEFDAEATELITSLGRWPVLSFDGNTRLGRTESRFANAVQFLCALRAAQFMARPEMAALMKLQGLERSQATELVSETWCDKAKSMLRRFGLHVQGLPGDKVFHFVLTKRRCIEEQKKTVPKSWDVSRPRLWVRWNPIQCGAPVR